jgi:hypothetical protein
MSYTWILSPSVQARTCPGRNISTITLEESFQLLRVPDPSLTEGEKSITQVLFTRR